MQENKLKDGSNNNKQDATLIKEKEALVKDDKVTSNIDNDINTSEVSEDKKSPTLKILFWILLVIVIMLGLSHCALKKTGDNGLHIMQSKNADAELHNNMQVIHKDKTAAQETATKVQGATAQTSQTTSDTSKNAQTAQDSAMEAAVNAQMQEAKMRELQARLSAPTSFMALSGGGGNQQPGPQNVGSAQGGSNNANAPTQAVLAGQGANANFANQGTAVDTASAGTIAHPTATVAQGELIEATLETPIDSDLPGLVRAVTTTPVYAYTGNQPLIPAGSRLIGQYSSGVIQGQSRIMVVWNRIVLPNGVTAQLNSPGTDDQGMAGEGADSINRHFWGQFGEASLLSIIGAGSANVGVSGSDQYNSASQYRSALSNSFSDSAGTVLDHSIDTKPTLKVYQGAQINVFVARDVDFNNVLGG